MTIDDARTDDSHALVPVRLLHAPRDKVWRRLGPFRARVAGTRTPMKRLLPLLTVLACEPSPEPPFVCGPVPQITVFVGEWGEGDLCFEDPEGAKLDIDLSLLNDLPVSQVQVWNAEKLRVLARWPGTTTVVVTATDPGGLQATRSCARARPEPRAGRGPWTMSSYPPASGRRSICPTASRIRTGRPLTYSASSAAPSVVEVAELSRGSLRLEHSGGEGSARISVTVSDGEDSVTTAFEATVVPPELVLSDEFDSEESLDDWTIGDYSRAEIEDGYLVLTAGLCRLPRSGGAGIRRHGDRVDRRHHAADDRGGCAGGVPGYHGVAPYRYLYVSAGRGGLPGLPRAAL